MAEEIVVKKKKKRRKKHYFLRFLIFIALIAGAILALSSDLFSVRKFEIEGNNYYTAAQVQETSGLSTGINIFEEKLRQAKDALLEDPYIKNVEIKRVLPGTIKIVITERVDYACLPYNGQYVLIDEEGMVLRLTNELPVLPLLEGIEISEPIPGKALDVDHNYLLSNTLNLLSVMADNDLFFKKINFSSVIVKAYIYDDLYCEGKPENIMAQMRAVKQLVEEQYSAGITRGVIKVGKDNYIAFSPKID